MARVTVEDCIDKVDSPYELVLVAKERATQLNTGIEPTLDKNNDKKTEEAIVDEDEFNISLAKMEEEIKPKILSILQTLTKNYAKLQKYQKETLKCLLASKELSI